MPADCGAPIGATLLSRFDMSDVENVKDADHQFRRCATDADFAGWARKWGGVSMYSLLNAPPAGWVDPDDMANFEADAARVQGNLAELRSAVEVAITGLERAMEGVADAVADKVWDVTSKLEEAL